MQIAYHPNYRQAGIVRLAPTKMMPKDLFRFVESKTSHGRLIQDNFPGGIAWIRVTACYKRKPEGLEKIGIRKTIGRLEIFRMGMIIQRKIPRPCGLGGWWMTT